MAGGIRTFDFYRKIPMDLTETTVQGAIMSAVAMLFMFVLFICELQAFLRPEIYSTVMLDTNRDSKLRINFNVTMLALPCEYATIDVLDVLGTNRVNITKNIIKWHTDERGRKVEFHGRNREQEDVQHDTHHRDLDLAHEDGEHALPIEEAAFPEFIAGNAYVIADFYAPWCVWCQRLAPTWEAFAETATEDMPQLRVIKVDCVANHALCSAQRIHAFPTIRFFKDGVAEAADYRRDRSLQALLEYSNALVGGDASQIRRFQRVTKDHPGCQISGFILVNRVPGNFHIEAQSKHHHINPAITNVSHVVHNLSFGTQYPVRAFYARAPRALEGILEGTLRMQDETFVTKDLHAAPHHYVKVVSTFLGKEWNYRGANEDVLQYQMIVANQIMPYDVEDVPEAKFSFDLSPMCVHVRTRARRWYDFVTSVMAIVGGTFTVVGVVDSILFRVLKQKAL
ncbi:endoplasmic reticulum-golgi intermediate compartment-domain-containing protein [Tribonema minus]|uniref:Endoplasmic reticulum-golgi intermediate compartment-domain-containing protein n=1 Tax=Tribonema minus TaxID=303371 RepID=A0A835YQ98_9STRA|nr:endoplasmic reticulum-golgi intermediate compartment-domain-containing protein [Tribonema minus]